MTFLKENPKKPPGHTSTAFCGLRGQASFLCGIKKQAVQWAAQRGFFVRHYALLALFVFSLGGAAYGERVFPFLCFGLFWFLPLLSGKAFVRSRRESREKALCFMIWALEGGVTWGVLLFSAFLNRDHEGFALSWILLGLLFLGVLGFALREAPHFFTWPSWLRGYAQSWVRMVYLAFWGVMILEIIWYALGKPPFVPWILHHKETAYLRLLRMQDFLGFFMVFFWFVAYVCAPSLRLVMFLVVSLLGAAISLKFWLGVAVLGYAFFVWGVCFVWPLWGNLFVSALFALIWLGMPFSLRWLALGEKMCVYLGKEASNLFLHWQELLLFIERHFFWGWGLGKGVRLSGQCLFVRLTFPHNMPLQLWLEAGGMSVLALCALVMAFSWRLGRLGKGSAFVQASFNALFMLALFRFPLGYKFFWLLLIALAFVWPFVWFLKDPRQVGEAV